MGRSEGDECSRENSGRKQTLGDLKTRPRNPAFILFYVNGNYQALSLGNFMNRVLFSED